MSRLYRNGFKPTIPLLLTDARFFHLYTPIWKALFANKIPSNAEKIRVLLFFRKPYLCLICSPENELIYEKTLHAFNPISQGFTIPGRRDAKCPLNNSSSRFQFQNFGDRIFYHFIGGGSSGSYSQGNFSAR